MEARLKEGFAGQLALAEAAARDAGKKQVDADLVVSLEAERASRLNAEQQLAAPRTDPSERNYRTGLLPWVGGGKASVWLRVQVPDGGQREERAKVLALAYEAHPERFVDKPPAPPALPGSAWINRPVAEPVGVASPISDGMLASPLRDDPVADSAPLMRVDKRFAASRQRSDRVLGCETRGNSSSR